MRTVGNGAIGVTPGMPMNVPASLTCNLTTFSARNQLAVDISGYTVWGAYNANCTNSASIAGNVGLNVPTPNMPRLAGWADNNYSGACGCGGGASLSPASISMDRGYFGLRR